MHVSVSFPTSHASLQDKSQCLPCSASSTGGFSEALGDCQCPDGSALVERAEDGSYLEEKKCVKCKQGSDGMVMNGDGTADDTHSTRHCTTWSPVHITCQLQRHNMPTENRQIDANLSHPAVGDYEQYLPVPWLGDPPSQREDCWRNPPSLCWAMAVARALSACIEHLMAAATWTNMEHRTLAVAWWLLQMLP